MGVLTGCLTSTGMPSGALRDSFDACLRQMIADNETRFSGRVLDSVIAEELAEVGEALGQSVCLVRSSL